MRAEALPQAQPVRLPRPVSWLFYLGWLVLFIFGAIGVYLRLTQQLRPTALGSYITWGLWISADIYFIGLSAGAFLLSSFVYVLRVKRLQPLGKLALFTAIITLTLAMLSAWFDIGHMERFYEVFTRPQFHSIMALVVWLYAAYFILLLVELWLAMRPDLVAWSQGTGFRAGLCKFLTFGSRDVSPQRIERDHRVLQVLGGIGVPLATAFHGGMGALFATLAARPYWYGGLYPIFFLTGALVSGSALLLALSSFLWTQRDAAWKEMVTLLGRVVLALLLFDLLLEWAEFSAPAWYGIGAEPEIFQKVLFGPYWWVFWIFHLALGALLPILLIWRWPRRPVALGIAGTLTAVMYMAVRLNIVIPGFITPELRGLERAFFDKRLTYSYVPTLAEWQVTLFVVALGIALFYLGYRLLPLVTPEKEVAS